MVIFDVHYIPKSTTHVPLEFTFVIDITDYHSFDPPIELEHCSAWDSYTLMSFDHAD